MSTTVSATRLSGYVAPLTAERQCRVALVDGDTQYPILPRGAGIDLADMVSTQVEVICTIQEEDSTKLLLVRSYTVLDSDEEEWFTG